MPGKTRKPLWIAIFVILLACFVTIPMALVATRPPLANEDNCRTDGVVPAHTVVLIDQSDPFKESDVEWVWQLIFDEAKALAKYGRLTVLGIDAEHPDDGLEAFSRCSPGAANRANPLYENPTFINEDWKSKFENEMKENVGELMLSSSAPKSPLAEHLKGILRRNDFRPGMETRRIILISDLHQNSDTYSNYKKGTQTEPFISYLESIEFPDLADVQVAIFRIDRDSELSPAELRKFWSEALGHFHVAKIQFVRD